MRVTFRRCHILLKHIDVIIDMKWFLLVLDAVLKIAVPDIQPIEMDLFPCENSFYLPLALVISG